MPRRSSIRLTRHPVGVAGNILLAIALLCLAVEILQNKLAPDDYSWPGLVNLVLLVGLGLGCSLTVAGWFLAPRTRRRM